jgi:hypothetical protein
VAKANYSRIGIIGVNLSMVDPTAKLSEFGMSQLYRFEGFGIPTDLEDSILKL